MRTIRQALAYSSTVSFPQGILAQSSLATSDIHKQKKPTPSCVLFLRERYDGCWLTLQPPLLLNGPLISLPSPVQIYLIPILLIKNIFSSQQQHLFV